MDKEDKGGNQNRPIPIDVGSKELVRHAEVIVETGFQQSAPAYNKKAGEIVERIIRGELTITDAMAEANAPVRTIVEALIAKIELPQELQRRLRQAQIGLSLMAPDRKEVHNAIKLSQDEDRLATDAGSRTLSEEMQENHQELT